MLRILIIDDSALSRKMLRKILEEAGYSVIEASDGMSALEIFSIESPDLVLLDLTMPGLTGMEVLSKLKRLKPGVKVIIESADIQSFTREDAFREGADGFINKPFVADEILRTIKEVLNS